MMGCDSPFKAVDAACTQAQCVKYAVETECNVLWLQSCVHHKRLQVYTFGCYQRCFPELACDLIILRGPVKQRREP